MIPSAMTCCPVKLHCLNTRIAYRVPPQLVRICVYVRSISTRCHEFLLQKQKGISAMPCSQCLQGIAASLCWTNSRRVLGRERRLYGSSPLVFFHSIHKGHDILPWDVRFDYVSRRDEKSSAIADGFYHPLHFLPHFVGSPKRQGGLGSDSAPKS